MRWLAATGAALLLAGCASVGTARTAGAPVDTSLAGTAAGLPSITSPRVAASPPVAAAPPVAASSPVNGYSETPLAMPTPSPGSEGTLPPMPPAGRTLDTNDPDSVWMAQNVIDVFAQEVEAVAQNSPDYCDVAVDGFHDGMTVWWHGTPSSAVLGVLTRARQAGVKPVVLPSPIERATLDAAVDRLANRMQELGMTELSRSSGCAGIDVGLLVATPQSEAPITAAAGPGIPIHFSETGPMSPA
jgi:hypothetical protein